MKESSQKQLKLGIYKHYKGKEYLVTGIARHSETLEYLVTYISLYDNSNGALWVRPLYMFLENVEVEGKTVPRFEYIKPY